MTAQDRRKVFFVLTLLCTAASAEASAVITTNTAIGSNSFMPSANVTVTAASDDTSFAAYSQHINGNRVFFCTSGDLMFFYSTKDGGSLRSVSPTPSQAVPSGWSSL